jgi:hypothetical protein
MREGGSLSADAADDSDTRVRANALTAPRRGTRDTARDTAETTRTIQYNPINPNNQQSKQSMHDRQSRSTKTTTIRGRVSSVKCQDVNVDETETRDASDARRRTERMDVGRLPMPSAMRVCGRCWCWLEAGARVQSSTWPSSVNRGAKFGLRSRSCYRIEKCFYYCIIIEKRA